MANRKLNIIDRARLSFAGWLIKAAYNPRGPMRLVAPWVKSSTFIPVWESLIREGYKANSAVTACATALAFAFSEPGLRVETLERDGTWVVDDKHFLNALLQRPQGKDGHLGLKEFLMFAIVYASVGGNFYGWIQRNALGGPVAIWPMNDGTTEPIPGQTTAPDEGFVKEYKYNPGTNTADDTVLIPAEDMIHWRWMVDPNQPWRGIGAIAAAALDVDTDNESSRYAFNLMQNDAVPRMVMTFGEGVELEDKDIKRLRAEWRQSFGGANRGEVGFVEHGEKIEKIGFSLAEMAYESIKAVPEARISANFRVPAIIAGLSIGLARSTYSNYQEARISWTEDTLIKLWEIFASELTQRLCTETERIVFDISKVGALAEKRAKDFDLALKGLAAGAITRAEARQLMMLPVTAADDIFLMPFSLIATPREQETTEVEEPAQTEDDESASVRRVGRKMTADEWWAVKEASVRMMWNIESDIVAARLGTDGLRSKVMQVRRDSQRALAAALQRIRRSVAGRMQGKVDSYYDAQSVRVMGRFNEFYADESNKQAEEIEATPPKPPKKIPKIEDLWSDADNEELVNVSRQFSTELIASSWDVWDLGLGSGIAFDLTDPGIQKLIDGAAKKITKVNNDTRRDVKELLDLAAKEGWSIDQMANGVTLEDGTVVKGLRNLVDETYKNRGKTIARTEMGNLQNQATTDRYKRQGIDKVYVLDNELENSDEICIALNGTVQSLAWAEKNSLQHPNCVRAFAPEF